MNNNRNVWLGIALGLSVTTMPAWAADAETADTREMPAVAGGAAATSIATVEALNLETREVILRETDGSVVAIIAGDEVRNLAQVKVGDRVITKYEVGLIMALSPAESGILKRVDTLEKGRAELGQKPAGIIRDTVEVTGVVKAVDAEKRMVTLQGALRTVTLPVAEDIDLANIKAGDQVNAMFRESLAITVVPAPMPAAGQ